MKKKDLFKKIPLPIPSSYGSEYKKNYWGLGGNLLGVRRKFTGDF